MAAKFYSLRWTCPAPHLYDFGRAGPLNDIHLRSSSAAFGSFTQAFRILLSPRGKSPIVQSPRAPAAHIHAGQGNGLLKIRRFGDGLAALPAVNGPPVLLSGPGRIFPDPRRLRWQAWGCFCDPADAARQPDMAWRAGLNPGRVPVAAKSAELSANEIHEPAERDNGTDEEDPAVDSISHHAARAGALGDAEDDRGKGSEEKHRGKVGGSQD